MDVTKLPIAAEHHSQDNVGVVAHSRELASPSHRDRPRIAVEPLGCLSVLDQGEQNGRPYAHPSPDLRNKIWMPNMKLKSQSIVHVQRPRAVLSSPENDDLSRELQERTEESKDIVIVPPKAPLSLPEELISTEERAIFAAENSISVMDTNHDNVDVCQPPKDSLVPSSCRNSLEPSQSRVSKQRVTKGKPIGQYSVSPRCQNDENFMTPTVRNQAGKKHTCMASASSSIASKSPAHKSMTKGDSGRVVRPWY